MEQQIGLIAAGKADKSSVVAHTVEQFRQKFLFFVQKVRAYNTAYIHRGGGMGWGETDTEVVIDCQQLTTTGDVQGVEEEASHRTQAKPPHSRKPKAQRILLLSCYRLPASQLPAALCC